MNPNEPNYGQLPPTPQPAPIEPSQGNGQYVSPAGQILNTPNPATGQNPYDFILNPDTTQKKPPRSGGNKAMRLLIGLGGITVVLIVASMVAMQFFAKGTPSTSLIGLVQRQQELIRIAGLGERTSQNEAIRGLAYNVELSIGTNQQQLMGFISKQGQEITKKELALKQDADTDKLLENARATSTYDSALQKVLSMQLQEYLSDLKTTYSKASSSQLKEILNASYTSGKLLLTQAEQST